jgi:hypothetical protein
MQVQFEVGSWVGSSVRFVVRFEYGAGDASSESGSPACQLEVTSQSAKLLSVRRRLPRRQKRSIESDL